MTRPTFGYVWLSVYDPAGAAKRMEALRALDPAAFARYRDSGGATTAAVQPPIPPDASKKGSPAPATPIRVSFDEGAVENPDTHHFELSPVFASASEARRWLGEHHAVTSVGVANRVLLTVSVRADNT